MDMTDIENPPTITITFNGKTSVDMTIEFDGLGAPAEQLAAAAWLMEMNAQDMFMQARAIQRFQDAQKSGGIELARSLPPNRAMRRNGKN